MQLQIQHYILFNVSIRTPHPLPFPPVRCRMIPAVHKNTHRRVLSFKSAFRKHTYYTLNTDACFDPDPFKSDCGICACSGGVFRDAYNVIGGVDRAIPVDVYAPGCAIRPETVIDAIVEACGILDQKEAVMRAGGDPLTVGGAATWDGGVELGEDGFVAAAGAGADGAGGGDTAAGTPATPAAAKEAE